MSFEYKFEKTCVVPLLFRVQNYDSIFTIPIFLAEKDKKGRIIFRKLNYILKVCDQNLTSLRKLSDLNIFFGIFAAVFFIKNHCF